MSHFRSNTRSKSNIKPSITPVIASTAAASSLRLRPPTMASPQMFLPPSHYAAAAEAWGEHTGESHVDYNSALSVEKERQQARGPRAEAVMPAADVNTPLLRGNSRSRSQTVSGRLEPDNGFDYDGKKNRKSHLPNLEALLLPSLRDTVDRMTRPHDKQLQRSSTELKIHLTPDTSYKSRFTETSASSTSSMIPRVSATEPPDLSDTAHHSQSVTRRKSSMKPVSRTSTTFSAPRDRAEIDKDSSRATYASKQVGPELASNRTYYNSARANMIVHPKDRTRSVTDPGSVVTSQPVKTIPQMPRTPQPRPVSRFRQPNTPSRIPRRGIASDSSDVDRDAYYRLGRLVVTNASIVPSSSSESEAEVQSPKYSTNSTSYSRASFSLHDQPRLPNGLGQNLQRDHIKPGNYLSMSPDNGDKRVRTPQVSPIRDEDSQEAIVSAKQPTETTRDSATSRSTSETQIQERRRTALLGIFDGIDFTAATKATNMMITDSESSLDRYQESTDLGLAISNSGDVHTTTEKSVQYSDDNDPEDHVPRSQNILGLPGDSTTPKPSNRSLSRRFSHQDLPLPQSSSTPNSPMSTNPFAETHIANTGGLESCSKNSLARAYTTSAGTITSDTVTLVDESLSLAARERLALGIPPSASDDLSGESGSFRLSHADSNLSTMSFGNSQEHAVDLSQGAEALFRKISLHKLEGSRQNGVYNRHDISLRNLSPSVSFSSNASSAPSVYDEDIDDTYDPRIDFKREVQTNFEMSEPSQSRLAVPNVSMASKVEHEDPRNPSRHHCPSRPHSIYTHRCFENSTATLDSDQISEISSTTSRRFARQYTAETHHAKHRRSKSRSAVSPHHDTVASTSLNELEGNQGPSSSPLPISSDTKNCPTIACGGTWVSTLSSRELDRILQKYGQQEVERQEVIVSFIESEQAFVDKFQVIVRLFIQPLRICGRKAWIEGIPSDICRLFDWLEDIVNLHSQLLSTLRTIQREQFPIILSFSEPLRDFVPRLEIYQPYLARVDTVLDSLSALLEKNDDFAIFVRLQETRNDDCKWRLLDVLSEPLDRLATLTDYFESLVNLTSKSHSDYLATFSLLHSTHTILRVMGEVKFREDDYDILKDIASRLHGLPDTTSLVCRERKLLVQGVLYNNDPHPPKQQNSLSIPPLLHTDTRDQRASKLFTAINEWDLRRQASLKSNASSGISFRTYESFNTLILRGKPLTSSVMDSRSRRQDVQVFIFVDLVLLTTPVAHEDSGAPVTWSLLPDIGLSRLLGVKEETADAGTRFTLDLLPMNATELQHGILSENARVFSIHLCTTNAGSHVAESIHPRKEEWLSAFQKCFEFTLRSLSFPSHSGGYLAHGPNVDLEMDTQEYVRALLGSGLPIPKSPSAQMQDTNTGNVKSRDKEREERGWWSLRFQQVLREMQRYNHI